MTLSTGSEIAANTIVLREEKGSPLSTAEFDWNLETFVDAINNGSETSVVGYDTIADMLAGDTDAPYSRVSGFNSAGDGGGGEFFWDSAADKADHNGGTIIDPTHSATPGAADWYTAENTGNGCWVMTPGAALHVAVFGALGTADDDSTAIQAAIDWAEADSYAGRIVFGASYTIGSTIRVKKPLNLIGGGTRSYQFSDQPNPGTVIAWGGSAGGTMFNVGPDEGAVYRPDGGSILGITLDGDGTAAIGFTIKSVRNWEFDICVEECTSINIRLGVVESLTESKALQNCRFKISGTNLTTEGTVLVNTGTTAEVAGGNVSLNVFEEVYVRHKNGLGIQLDNSDNNVWHIVRVYRHSGGTGNAIIMEGSDFSSTHCCRNEKMGIVSTIGAIIVRGTDTYTHPSIDSIISHLDRGNATPVPTVETDASCYWTTNLGVQHQLAAYFAAFGTTESNTYSTREDQSAEVVQETVRIRSSTGRNLLLEDTNGNKFTIDIESSGDMRLRMLNGGGNVNLVGASLSVGGNQVIGVRQTGVASMTNLSAPSNLNADTVTVGELADIVGNLIAKLKLHGLVAI